MKLSKTLGTVLYQLFGPNGSDQVVGGARDLRVYRELARHGLIKLESHPRMPGLFHAKRTCRGLDEATIERGKLAEARAENRGAILTLHGPK